ncbi:MAG: nucleotidyltransferase [Terracidiphilus sp.]|nr:nucleotidyltransferase [Terracidiphilus sp.]MDR3799652.1 nucleotidyltransferase [Terracidiphilus sp.]
MTSASSPTLLVLAAGMGSRYGGLKQIDPVGPSGETIIDYSIFDALRAGFGKVVFVIRKDIEEAFREIVGSRFEKRLAVDYAFQSLEDIPQRFTVPAGRTKPWGTTQAIIAGASAVREPFAAINADDFYGAESFRVLAGHLTCGSPDYAMVGFILRNTLSEFGTVARGVCELADGNYLKGIVEYLAIGRDGDSVRNVDASGTVTQFTGNEPVSLNFWGFTPRIFDQLRESFETFLEQSGADAKRECLIPTTLNDLVAAGKARVKVLPAEGSWFGVTYREDRPRVIESIRALIATGAYPEKLWP